MNFDQRPAALRAVASVLVTFCLWRRCAPPGLSVGAACRAALWGGLLLLAAPAAWAQPPQIVFNKQLRDEAVQAIPMSQLGEAARTKVLSVVTRPTIYRRLPTQVVDCDPDLHVFLLRYPEVVVNIWQMMGITKVKVNRTAPYAFDALDGAGTVSRAELIFGTPEVHVYYADGTYDGPLFHNPIAGNCVLVVRSSYAERGGKSVVTCTMDVFARLDHLGVEILVKTLYPAVARAVDINFSESVKFVSQVSQAAELNGPGMQRLASQLGNVQPAVRESFSQHINLAYQRAVLRNGVAAEPLASSTSMLPPAPAADAVAETGVSWEADESDPSPPVAVPSAHLDPGGPRTKPTFRR
jgi:hypothetical protein